VPKKRFDVEVPEGTHLGVSRDTDGAYRAHLFDDDTNELVGHAELFEPVQDAAEAPTEPSPVFVYIDDRYEYEARVREPSEAEKLVGNLLLLGVLIAVEKAKPHVKEWWAEQARPALRAKWNGLAESKPSRTSRRTSVKASATSGAAVDESPNEVLDALDAYKVSMSSEEARARFVTAVSARLVSEEQLAILRNARIEGIDGPLELKALTPHQIAEALAAVLEANPSLLDADRAAAELGRLLKPAPSDPVAVSRGRSLPLRLPSAGRK
jgi:hypothetical protein